MKKRVVYLMLALVLATTTFFTSCGGGGGNEDATKDKTVVKVTFYEGGFGRDWILDLKERYEKIHPDVYIKIEGDPSIEATVKDRLDTQKVSLTDDILISAGTFYRYMVRKDYLLDLSSFYDEEVENGDTIDDLVNQQIKDYFTVNGKVYGVPWQDNAMSFVYNAGMFEQYGWQIPTTMDEFFALCEQIRDDTNNAVNPLSYCGKSNQGYFPGVMENWLAQYEGVSAMKDFLDCETAEVYQNQEAGRTKVYQTVSKIMLGTDSKGRRYVDTKSRGYSHLNAQAELLYGRSAMVISGPWMQIEMSEYLKDYPNFKMGIMQTPHINSDKKDKNGVDSSNVRTSSTGCMVIPKNAVNKEIALDFIKFSLTQESLQKFIVKTDGLTRPYTLKDTSKIDFSNNYFANTVFTLLNTNTDRMIYTVSKSDIWLAGEASMWMCNDGSPVTALQNLTLEQALSKSIDLAKEDYSIIKEKWNTWNVI